MRSARPELPVPSWPRWIVFVPSALPTASATTTRPIQPKIAVLRWAALQRPMRAASGALGGVLGDMGKASARAVP